MHYVHFCSNARYEDCDEPHAKKVSPSTRLNPAVTAPNRIPTVKQHGRTGEGFRHLRFLPEWCDSGTVEERQTGIDCRTSVIPPIKATKTLQQASVSGKGMPVSH
jgi:hypothetical protein